MSHAERPAILGNPDYPTAASWPVSETDDHRINMLNVIDMLQRWFSPRDDVYVSGNSMICYEEGNKRAHVSPDVFVVKGVPGENRLNFIVWEEGKAPDCVIEMTSRTTRRSDMGRKFELYQDVLKVPEYFLFDPHVTFLVPHLQGYRLVDGVYQRIEPVAGRLPSEELGLHLDPDGKWLRFWNPVTKQRLLDAQGLLNESQESLHKSQEQLDESREQLALTKEKLSREAAEAERLRLEARREREAAQRYQAQAAELAAELERLRQALKPSPGDSST